MSSDYGDWCRELREEKRERRAAFGIECPECKRLLPKAFATILLPGQSCTKRGHKYRDTRTRNDE